jgi:hypothetical protein
MSGSLPHKHPNAPNAIEDESAGAVTRRTVLTGAAAATAAATVAVALDTPARARSVDPNSREDTVLFVLLSSALTGIAPSKLAPGFTLAPPPTNPPTVPPPPIDLSKSVPGSDPVNVKQEYLRWANEKYPSGLEYLLHIVRKNLNASNRDEAIIAALQFDDDDKTKAPADVQAKYLARSIVLMWYLGAWYEPTELRALRNDLPKDPTRSPIFKIISPKAYTQAWALRVAQAHPMGFSEMQFGYWTRQPNDIHDFIGGQRSS